ncbi:MAG: hypothetical protein ACF8NJ_11065 [Phycisphaerales bacterium JB038]
MKGLNRRFAVFFVILSLGACSDPGSSPPADGSDAAEAISKAISYGLQDATATRELLLVGDTDRRRSLPPTRVAQAMEVGMVETQSVLSCPAEPGGLSRCSMPTGIVLVSYSLDQILGTAGVVDVSYRESDGAGGSHMWWYRLRLVKSTEGWEVGEVIAQGAS